jgi:hypothetical protein
MKKAKDPDVALQQQEDNQKKKKQSPCSPQKRQHSLSPLMAFLSLQLELATRVPVMIEFFSIYMLLLYQFLFEELQLWGVG